MLIEETVDRRHEPNALKDAIAIVKMFIRGYGIYFIYSFVNWLVGNNPSTQLVLMGSFAASILITVWELIDNKETLNKGA